MLKGIGFLAVLLFLGGYVAGVFGPQAYSRTVKRPPAEVMAALATLDLPSQPGAPGSTAAAAGGVQPLFRLERADNRITWYVMSGDKVATAMTASFEPVDGGKATLIRTNVQRGDAPDDLVSPAFRSTRLTMGLFGMAIEGKVNQLVTPVTRSPEDCQKLIDQYAAQSPPPMPSDPRHQSFAQGMGEGITNIMKVNAMAAQLRQQGCDTNEDGSFRNADAHPLSQAMLPAADDGQGGQPVIVPGKPMLDPRPAGDQPIR